MPKWLHHFWFHKSYDSIFSVIFLQAQSEQKPIQGKTYESIQLHFIGTLDKKKSSGGVRKWRLFDFKWFFSLRGEPMTCLNYKINQDEIKIHKKISAERIVQKLLVQLLIQVNFMYSKKATKFCEISTFCGLLLPSQNIWSLKDIVN